jgi:hypothetical protein
MPLFEVALIQHGGLTATGPAEKLIFGPEAVIAKDAKTATLIAVSEACTSTGDPDFDPECSEVLVRPFVP